MRNGHSMGTESLMEVPLSLDMLTTVSRRASNCAPLCLKSEVILWWPLKIVPAILRLRDISAVTGNPIFSVRILCCTEKQPLAWKKEKKKSHLEDEADDLHIGYSKQIPWDDENFIHRTNNFCLSRQSQIYFIPLFFKDKIWWLWWCFWAL